jgi:CHAT domain-containing protein
MFLQTTFDKFSLKSPHRVVLQWLARQQAFLHLRRSRINGQSMEAGTPSVVVSFWSVDELSTDILMRKFYEFLLE